jgi:thioester reductase-like protein
VEKVVLLVRPKRNISAHDRVARMLQGPLFSKLQDLTLKEKRSCLQDRIQVVEGDVCNISTELSDQDYAMITANVSIVLHCAASLSLDEEVQTTLRYLPSHARLDARTLSAD